MALVVEDGTGKADANAYLSLAEANTYQLTYNPTSTTWSAASDDDKNTAIIQATQFLDLVYLFKGLRVRREQALEWPRIGCRDREFLLDSDIVPVPVKNAAAEAALRALSAELMPDIDEPGRIKRERVKVGSLEKDTEYMVGREQIKFYRKIDQLLRHLVDSGIKVVRR